MKKRFLILIILIALLSIPANGYLVTAESNYLRVINATTPFYTDKEMTNVAFYLPYTYYVKVLEINGDVAHIECYGNQNTLKLDGYTNYSSLFSDNLSKENPYLSLTITTSSATKFYTDSTLKNYSRYIFKDRNLTYYGSLTTEDNVLFYVGYNGELGYVLEDNVYPFTVNDQENELSFIVKPEVTPTEKAEETLTQTAENNTAANTLRIIIISLLVLAGLIALFTIKRPKKSQTAVSYYDENDYE